jgi:hypothetical protein
LRRGVGLRLKAHYSHLSFRAGAKFSLRHVDFLFPGTYFNGIDLPLNDAEMADGGNGPKQNRGSES